MNRMSVASVSKKRTDDPDFWMLVGVEGVGKTGFGVEATGSVILPAEEGLLPYPNAAAFPRPETWDDVRAVFQSLLTEKHDYKTLVVDTLDAVEVLLCKHVCAQNRWPNMNALDYMNCWLANLDPWREFINDCHRLRKERGMEVGLIAHAQVKAFRNPSGADYDTYAPKLEKRAIPLFREQVNAMLFATFEETVVKGKKEAAVGDKGKVVITGQRIILTERRNGWEGKNRWSLPAKLPLSYAEYAKARLAKRVAPTEDLYTEAMALLAKLPKETQDKATPYIEQNKSNATILAEVVNRFRVLAEGKE